MKMSYLGHWTLAGLGSEFPRTLHVSGKAVSFSVPGVTELSDTISLFLEKCGVAHSLVPPEQKEQDQYFFGRPAGLK